MRTRRASQTLRWLETRERGAVVLLESGIGAGCAEAVEHGVGPQVYPTSNPLPGSRRKGERVSTTKTADSAAVDFLVSLSLLLHFVLFVLHRWLESTVSTIFHAGRENRQFQFTISRSRNKRKKVRHHRAGTRPDEEHDFALKHSSLAYPNIDLAYRPVVLSTPLPPPGECF